MHFYTLFNVNLGEHRVQNALRTTLKQVGWLFWISFCIEKKNNIKLTQN
jgi:hypothetical protein